MTPANAALPAPSFDPPRAAAFIVTIYGDLAEPRGGVLWMGSLIALCAQAGLSETLVRTAVSRLVVAGQLAGAREGRRSYYSLTPGARAAFEAAAGAIFRPPGMDAAEGWLWLIDPVAAASETLGQSGFAAVAPGLWLGPDRAAPGLKNAGGGRMWSAPATGTAAIAAFVARHWDLPAHAARYRAVIARFAPLDAQAANLAPAQALALRLRLVHDFRQALLRDPRLPRAALPRDWPGPAARRMFCRIYATLSPAAEAGIAAGVEGRSGPLPAQTATTRARLRALATAAATG